MIAAGPSAAVVVPPSPPIIAGGGVTCSELDGATGSAVATFAASAANSETRSYQTTFLRISPSSILGGAQFFLAPGESATDSASGLTAGDYRFSVLDQQQPDLDDQLFFTIEACPPPATTTTATATTTTTTPATTTPLPTTSTTTPATTTPDPTTSVGVSSSTAPLVPTTAPPPPTGPTPDIAADSGATLPATGSSPAGPVAVAGLAAGVGVVVMLTTRRRVAGRSPH